MWLYEYITSVPYKANEIERLWSLASLGSQKSTSSIIMLRLFQDAHFPFTF